VAEPVTLAIPFHRGAAYLREAVESVRMQSSEDWRLVVVDDRGGEEDVSTWLTGLADPRIRYERNPANLGMVPCWNRCLELAETDRVTLLHGDDRLEPGYVALMQELCALHPQAVAFFCEARIIDETGSDAFSLADRMKPWLRPAGGENYALEGEPALAALARGNFIMCPTLCWSRARLGKRRFDPRWRQVQDLDLTTRLLLEGERLVGSRVAAYVYRRHPDATTVHQSGSLLRFDEEIALLDEVAVRAHAKGWGRAAKLARRRDTVRLHLLQRAALDLAHGRLGRARRELAMAWTGRGNQGGRA